MGDQNLFSGVSHTDEIVTGLYRGLLDREPEPGAIAQWSPVVESNGVAFAIKAFLGSEEFRFRARHLANLYPFDIAPAQPIETEISSGAMTRLWARVSDTWTRLGHDDPYFSVITDPRWRGHPERERIDAFYATGAGEIMRLEAWLSRNGLQIDPSKICVEYGCGVGRTTEWLAQKFKRVIAFDVSKNHLNLARKRGEEKNISARVEYLHLVSPTDLSKLSQIDFFYSVIVLQHNPPPIITHILETVFAGLNKGGIAFFQVPTRGSKGYRFSLEDYLSQASDGKMEMHAVDQNTIFRLAARHNVRPVEIESDNCAGPDGISKTFLMCKQ